MNHQNNHTNAENFVSAKEQITDNAFTGNKYMVFKNCTNMYVTMNWNISVLVYTSVWKTVFSIQVFITEFLNTLNWQL